MNLKAAFWKWVVTHAQTIQNVDVHLAYLEVPVAEWISMLFYYLVTCYELVPQIWWSCFMVHLFCMCLTFFKYLAGPSIDFGTGINL